MSMPQLKKNSILIADDNLEMRNALAGILEAEGYQVFGAGNGIEAQKIFDNNVINAIVSDINMPQMNGLELLNYVTKTRPTPFILITGFSEIIESQEASKLGASDFILKPFKREELLASVEMALNTAQDKKDDDLDFEYCRLSIDEFVSGKVSIADVYVRLSNTRYIKVARKASVLSFDRIEAYKARGLKFLFIKKEDFSRYVGFNTDLAKAAVNRRGITKSQKVRLLKHTSEILVQEMYVLGMDEEKVEQSRAFVEALVSALTEDEDIFTMLEHLRTQSDYLYAHSLGVALYSNMIAKEVGWSASYYGRAAPRYRQKRTSKGNRR